LREDGACPGKHADEDRHAPCHYEASLHVGL
jgi:hypothetical protein